MDVGKPIIAVVDDDAGVRDSIRSLLKLAGYESAVFSSADEFVHADPPTETKCLVLDVKMPGMNGLQLQRLMKTVRPSLPLIFISAHYDENIRDRAMNEGAVSFLAKPFDSAELLRTIAACLPSDAQQTRHQGAFRSGRTQAHEVPNDLRSKVHVANVHAEQRQTEDMEVAREAVDRPKQGLSSASPQVHDAPDWPLEKSQVRMRLTRAINGMRRAIGRRAVQDLRSDRNDSSRLVELFGQIQDELKQFGQAGERPNLYLLCEGRAKNAACAVEDEVYKIGLEAVINAIRHAHASNIEIVVVFHANSLSLSVRDDGCGIESKLVDADNGEHLGLAGIRRRADRIGARLRIWSARGCGTELELKVPGPVAFPDLQSRKS